MEFLTTPATGVNVVNGQMDWFCPGCILEEEGWPLDEEHVTLAVAMIRARLLARGVSITRIPPLAGTVGRYLEDPWHDAE